MEFNQHFSSSSRETLSVLTYSLRGYLAQATVKATFQAQEGLSRMPFLTRKQTTCENRILRISCKQSNINMNHMDMIQFNKHEPHGYDSLHMNMNHMYAHMNEPHEPHMNHTWTTCMNHTWTWFVDMNIHEPHGHAPEKHMGYMTSGILALIVHTKCQGTYLLRPRPDDKLQSYNP